MSESKRNPVLLIHGYSDSEKGFARWGKVLADNGYDVSSIHACNYKTLTNEVTLRDIAEGFDRALKFETQIPENGDFDVIVHSTGMLVIRAWLAAYAHRRSRVKHLIGLAPASFGSPLAHKGRSWLGALFKGNKELSPDFMEAGDLVLDGLELGSKFTWDLAHRDIVDEGDSYGLGSDTPYVFVFCGTKKYGGLRKLVNEDGTDGTVRLAGCSLNSRKIKLDLTVEASSKNRVSMGDWCNLDIPLYAIEGLNHATILSDPSPQLIDLVLGALRVNDEASFGAWSDNARGVASTERLKEQWQQFVVRLVDERGDPVPDYHIEISAGPGTKPLEAFERDVHAYKADQSFRCFHVRLDELNAGSLGALQMRLVARSGSTLVGYYGIGSERIDPDKLEYTEDVGTWDATIDLSGLLPGRQAASSKGDAPEIRFFAPFTTTLVEIKINREPMPPFGKNKVFQIMTGDR